jgi:hypothetical protein
VPAVYIEAYVALHDGLPAYVEPRRWSRALDDCRTFMARWGDQAAALGWTVEDLFGLAEVPERPHATFSRLSRVDQAGLLWLLRGNEVVALTATSATIRGKRGSLLTFYKRPGARR